MAHNNDGARLQCLAPSKQIHPEVVVGPFRSRMSNLKAVGRKWPHGFQGTAETDCLGNYFILPVVFPVLSTVDRHPSTGRVHSSERMPSGEHIGECKYWQVRSLIRAPLSETSESRTYRLDPAPARDAGFSRSGVRAFSRRLNERNPSTPGIGRSVPVTRCSSRSTTVSAGTTTGASKRRDSDGSDRRSAGITPFCAGGMGRTLGLSCGAGRSSRSCHLHCG